MHALTNPNASECARKLYEKLKCVYGQRILLAQQEFPVKDKWDQEMNHIESVTGHLPVIRGLDFMHDDYRGTIERSRAWHERGGIVSICWHTGLVGKGYLECLNEKPDFDAVLTRGTAEHELLMRRFSDAADALEVLQGENIPVLWRPFHEFSGGWFWWGKGGSAFFVKLWRLMYDYFTKERRLNHLIWVLGFPGSIDEDWYPGDEYCDIAGSDTYDGVTTNAAAFRALQALCPDKMLAFHECGTMPLPDAFERDGAMWLWMMPWHNEWLLEKNSPENLCGVYRDARTLTLSEWNELD